LQYEATLCTSILGASIRASFGSSILADGTVVSPFTCTLTLDTNPSPLLPSAMSRSKSFQMGDSPKFPILIVCGGGYVSGKEIVVLELGQGLVHSGQPVSVLASSWNNRDFVTQLRRAGLPAQTLPIGFISATLKPKPMLMTSEQIWFLPSLLRKYARVLRNLRPRNVVHTNWHHLLLLLPFLRAQRDLYWLHEFVPNRPLYRRLFQHLSGRLKCFVCVSHAVAGSLRHLGIDESKIRVVHNGITDLVSETSPSSCATPFRIGIVGQVGVWKGHDDLLDAFAIVHQTHAMSELHIFGTGDATYKRELESKAGLLGVSQSVKWHDFVSDRRAIYKQIDVCVVPSRSQDPLPTSAIEAGFSGLPVIATRRGGLPEIIEHEQNGLLVEAERPEEIAQAIGRLIDNPQFRRRLALNARGRAAERFGQERFIAEFRTLLEA